MGLVKDFTDSIAERFSDFSISSLSSTRHSNVLRLTRGTLTYVAKSIWFDSEDSSDEDRAQNAFETEVAVLKMLPPFWGIRYVDSFVSSSRLNRIIVTTELRNCTWGELHPKNYERIARSIQRQIKWLHDNKIVHGDLELKNILLSCDQTTATLIDFEKSKINDGATKEEKMKDKERLLSAVKDATPSFLSTFTHILSGRRASIGGKRRCISRVRKTRKNKTRWQKAYTEAKILIDTPQIRIFPPQYNNGEFTAKTHRCSHIYSMLLYATTVETFRRTTQICWRRQMVSMATMARLARPRSMAYRRNCRCSFTRRDNCYFTYLDITSIATKISQIIKPKCCYYGDF
jgi:tRNA A-37 threonylcarbamoyl transferase component Bud32